MTILVPLNAGANAKMRYHTVFVGPNGDIKAISTQANTNEKFVLAFTNFAIELYKKQEIEVHSVFHNVNRVHGVLIHHNTSFSV